MCKNCGRDRVDHCSDCGCCWPAEVEHPAYCDYAPTNRDQYGRSVAIVYGRS
jgi:hypothetical protein